MWRNVKLPRKCLQHSYGKRIYTISKKSFQFKSVSRGTEGQRKDKEPYQAINLLHKAA
jgi:hypothetical protein